MIEADSVVWPPPLTAIKSPDIVMLSVNSLLAARRLP